MTFGSWSHLGPLLFVMWAMWHPAVVVCQNKIKMSVLKRKEKKKKPGPKRLQSDLFLASTISVGVVVDHRRLLK
jgi:hypothetical protein